MRERGRHAERDEGAPATTRRPAHPRPVRRCRRDACLFVTYACVFAAFGASVGNAADKPVFRHPFDGQPIEIPEARTKTPALEQFKQTGADAYRSDPSAIARGKELYDQWCQVCHAADASGAMCPALTGSEHIYPQTSDDVGMFAILVTGASGAMQSFAGRIAQDDMLKIIAYVRTLGK